MIIIHTETDEDSRRLNTIYNDLPNITLIKNKTKDIILKQLSKIRPNEVIMFLGHGDKFGLGGFKEEYSIDINSVRYLKDKVIIGIWCYASEFANLFGLHGFFTSMFITNQSEAFDLGYRSQTQADIYRELDLFCENVNELLLNNIKLSDWPEILRSSCHNKIPFVRFNYEKLEYII